MAGLTLHAKWAARPCALLYSDGLLSLQLGPVADASHGRVLARWEWDGSSRPWHAMRDRVTNVVAADAIALGRDSFETSSDLPNCEGMDLSLLDVSDVADLSYMFADCPSLAELGVSGWDVPEGAATDGAFYGCGSLGSVSLGKGCAALAEQLGGPWFDNEGAEHASIAADALPGTFTKTDPGALSLASVDGAATFDDVAAAPEAQATDRVADGSQGTIASDAEFEDVATEEPAGSDGPASDADTAQPSEAESAADSGTSADSGATEVDSDASDAGQAYTADAPDASEADVPADAGQSCGADAPADGADGSQDCATDQPDSQADVSADFEIVDLASEEIQDLAA